MKKKNKWVVCQLENFNGDVRDFARDAGLFCRAFNELGYDTKLILKAPSKEGELKEFVVRGTEEELSSVEWWRKIDEENVFLYPQRFTSNINIKIVKAIKKSGKQIVAYMDVGSEIYPFHSWWFYTKLIFRKHKIKNSVFFVVKSIFDIIKQHLTLFNFNRYRFFKLIDFVVFPSPISCKHHLSIPFYLPNKIKKKSIVAACPIDWSFSYDGTKKEDIVLAIGRWDDEEQKRSQYLMKAIEYSLDRTDAIFHIFGVTPQRMHDWHSRLPQEYKLKVVLHECVPNSELREYYNKARIVLCTSIHESTHLVSAEGLCLGCSVVVTPCPTLSCIHWYTSKNSGTISRYDTPEAFSEAIVHELRMWEINRRNPSAISQQWQDELHVTQTVKKVLNRIG